jgi:SAM-dependent methyltransferase
MKTPSRHHRAMLRLFDAALLAPCPRPPLVVALGNHAAQWRAHLTGPRGCEVVEVDVTRDPPDIADELAGRADLVCAFDVLHNVRDPLPWLRTTAQLLRPHGHFLTTVPNAASLWWHRTLARNNAHRPIWRGALVREHQHAGFLTLAHGYFGWGVWGMRHGADRPGTWARAWRRRLAPSLYYLGARAAVISRPWEIAEADVAARFQKVPIVS